MTAGETLVAVTLRAAARLAVDGVISAETRDAMVLDVAKAGLNDDG